LKESFYESFMQHKGNLVKLNTNIWWYAKNKFDNDNFKICLVLEVFHENRKPASFDGIAMGGAEPSRDNEVIARLLIDENAQIIRCRRSVVEFI